MMNDAVVLILELDNDTKSALQLISSVSQRYVSDKHHVYRYRCFILFGKASGACDKLLSMGRSIHAQIIELGTRIIQIQESRAI